MAIRVSELIDYRVQEHPSCLVIQLENDLFEEVHGLFLRVILAILRERLTSNAEYDSIDDISVYFPASIDYLLTLHHLFTYDSDQFWIFCFEVIL